MTLGKLRERCIAWDTFVFEGIFHARGRPIYDASMVALSRSADGPWYILLALILLAFDFEAWHMPVAVATLAFILELICYKSIKHIVKRQRPCIALRGVHRRVRFPDLHSFPSGHTAGAFVLATTFSLFVPALTLPVFVWAAGVGYSRIYNGVHYPADVLAGTVLGMASAFIMYGLAPGWLTGLI